MPAQMAYFGGMSEPQDQDQRDGTHPAEDPVAQVLNKAQPEALSSAPVEIVTDAAGNTAFWAVKPSRPPTRG